MTSIERLIVRDENCKDLGCYRCPLKMFCEKNFDRVFENYEETLKYYQELREKLDRFEKEQPIIEEKLNEFTPVKRNLSKLINGVARK